MERSGILGIALIMAVAGRSSAGEGVPDSRLGMPIAPILLLSRPDVQVELKLTPDQVEASNRAIEELRERAFKIAGLKGEAADAARRTVDQESAGWLNRRLSDEQRDRLIQLSLQWEGPSAIVTRPVVGESLGINPKQADAIQKAVARRNASRGKGPPVRAVERQFALDALAVLDDSQRERWDALLGRAFFRMAERPEPAPTTRR